MGKRGVPIGCQLGPRQNRESGVRILNVRPWYFQLDQTQKLVQQLSSQLADLRDQMTEQRKHKQRMGLLNSAPSLINIGDRH